MIELLDRLTQTIDPLRVLAHIFRPHLSDVVSEPKGSLLPAQRSESSGNPGKEESPLLYSRLLSSFSPDYTCLKP